MNSNASHFARQLVGQTAFFDSAPSRAARGGASSVHTSTSARAVGLPTLGDTGIKFNSNRWSQASAESGLSVFDMRGAMEALEAGPETTGARRAHPAQLAHAARIARAQQAGVTLAGFKVFPDLTPGRAFMWGSILAVYCVGAASYLTARSVGVTSVDDIKVKMQAAFAPYKEALQARASAARGNLQPHEQPAFLESWKAMGANLASTLKKPEQLLQEESAAEHTH